MTTTPCALRSLALSAGLAGLAVGQSHSILPNRGQWQPEAHACVRHGAMTTWLTDRGFRTRAVDLPRRTDPAQVAAVSIEARAHVFDVEFVGGRCTGIELSEPRDGVTSFRVGRDTHRHVDGVRHFAAAVQEEVWPGIDVSWSTRDGSLAYDFVVAPGASADAIRLRVLGAESSAVDDEGNLVLDSSFGRWRHTTPVAWQLGDDGSRQPVDVRFSLRVDGTVGLALGAVDPAHAVRIDPSLQWTSLLGGSSSDLPGYRQTLDRRSDGLLLVCGRTFSTDFPVTHGPATVGLWDGYVSAIRPGGALDWSCLLGTASGNEGIRACAWSDTGDAWFGGYTDSPAFPTSPGAPQPNKHPSAPFDMIVGRLSVAAGAPLLNWSTYLGGDRRDLPGGMAALAGGRVVVHGQSDSAALFTHAGAADGTHNGGLDNYVAVLDPTRVGAAAIPHATWFGGSGDEIAGAVVEDPAGGFWCGGMTESAGLPTSGNALIRTHQGQVDGHVFWLDSTLSRVDYATYIGGAGDDEATDLDVTPRGGVLIGSHTEGLSLAMPGTAFQPNPLGGRDGYVLHLDPAGHPAQPLRAGTYLGTARTDGINGITSDSAGRATVVGWTRGFLERGCPVSTFPETFQSLQSFQGGGWGGTDPTIQDDAILSRLDLDLTGSDQLVYSTHLGGLNSAPCTVDSGWDFADDVVLDGVGRATVLGRTFAPSWIGGLRNSGNRDLFLIEIEQQSECVARLTPPPPSVGYLDVAHRELAGGLVQLTFTATDMPAQALVFFLLGAPNPAGVRIPGVSATLMLQVPGFLVQLPAVFANSYGVASVRLTAPLPMSCYGVAVQGLWTAGSGGLSATDALIL